jgi:hypothetical protein
MFELLLESKYVHKKDEWLGYGDYAVVLSVWQLFSSQRHQQGSELAALIFAGAQDGRLFSPLTTHIC